MRQVTLQMSMSLDGYVASDREHPGTAVPEDAELVRWKLDRVAKAGAHLMGRTTYEEMAGDRPPSGASVRGADERHPEDRVLPRRCAKAPGLSRG